MKIFENISAPIKSHVRETRLFIGAIYQIKSAKANLLVSFPGQNLGRTSQGDSVELWIQSVMRADVWWRRSRIRIE